MKVLGTSIPGLVRISLDLHSDDRGLFAETWQRQRYRGQGIDADFTQDNMSSSHNGVLRGLHYQIERPQGHLVTVMRGKIFDVGVDLRLGSPTFGQWTGVTLSRDQPCQVYLPPGIAHGFCVLSERADVLYKCTTDYRPGDEGGILWSDPDLGIPWPISEPEISRGDRQWPRLRDIPAERLPHASFSMIGDDHELGRNS